ncbi:MAG: M42 family peptidase [Clostridiales bacterium]|nr:M42 family peptidase [Clostridiales bacterium]
MNREFLHELLNTPSVSGHEEEIQRKTIQYTADFCDKQEADATGNVLHRINPDAPFQVLMMGHIDEIGFLVTHIDESGMIKVMSNGGLRLPLYVGARVQIIHDGKKVPGVVSVARDLVGNKEIKANDLTIDIGAGSKEEALQYAAPGDPVCADTLVEDLVGEKFTSRAMDNRTGAFVVMEALKRAKELGATIGVTAATTVGEETSMRGAAWAAASHAWDLAIAVDVTYVSDCPGTNPADTGDVKLGGGPVLCTATTVNKKANHMFVETAEEKGIQIQWEVASGHTGTDADRAHISGKGIPVALVSIPLRYMHSSVEVADYRDIENAIELLGAFMLKVGPGVEWKNLSVLKK